MSGLDDEARTTLAALVASLGSPAVDPATIDESTPLIDGGLGLDSVALLELVVLLEDRLGVVLATEDVGSGSFSTFGSLAALVARRRG